MLPVLSRHLYMCRSMGEQFTVHYSDLNLQAELPPDSVYPIGKIKSHFFWQFLLVHAL